MKKIAVKASNSPLGGGSVRVYSDGKLVWVKRCSTVVDVLKGFCEAKQVVDGIYFKKGLRLV